MPKVTGSQTNVLASDWTQVSNAGDGFLISCIDGDCIIRFAATKPAVNAPGHPLLKNDTYGETASTADNACWVRAGAAGAIVVITK